MGFSCDLNTGYPDTKALVPRGRMAKITADLIISDQGTQYAGDILGPMPARQVISDYVAQTSNLPVGEGEFMITAGAIAACDLVCRAVTEPGDLVAFENPTFFFMTRVFGASRVRNAGVPMTEQGIDLNALEALAKREQGRLKLVYLITSFHNPTGMNTSAATRAGLVDLARRYGFKILEDVTYQWLYFDSPPPPLCRTFDPAGEVVFSAGSFSKVLMPSLRQGWLWSGAENMTHVARFKGDAAASLLTTRVVADFIRRGWINDQYEFARLHYGGRCAVLCEALREHLPPEVQWQAPMGGYFVWLTLPKGMNADDVRVDANKHGCDFMPGRLAYVEAPDARTMRLCFTLMNEDKLRQGARLIGESIRAAGVRA